MIRNKTRFATGTLRMRLKAQEYSRILHYAETYSPIRWRSLPRRTAQFVGMPGSNIEDAPDVEKNGFLHTKHPLLKWIRNQIITDKVLRRVSLKCCAAQHGIQQYRSKLPHQTAKIDHFICIISDKKKSIAKNTFSTTGLFIGSSAQ